jgi:hypothetical protein
LYSVPQFSPVFHHQVSLIHFNVFTATTYGAGHFFNAAQGFFAYYFIKTKGDPAVLGAILGTAAKLYIPCTSVIITLT